MNAPATAAAYPALVRRATEPGAPVPESRAQLLATVQRLWDAYQLAPAVEKPVLWPPLVAASWRFKAVDEEA